MKELAYGVMFCILFAAVAGVGGLLYGYWSGLEYERATGYGGGNGPLIFIVTTPVGAAIGLFFGLWLANRQGPRD
jgi:hypothetical protein